MVTKVTARLFGGVVGELIGVGGQAIINLREARLAAADVHPGGIAGAVAIVISYIFGINAIDDGAEALLAGKDMPMGICGMSSCATEDAPADQWYGVVVGAGGGVGGGA